MAWVTWRQHRSQSLGGLRRSSSRLPSQPSCTHLRIVSAFDHDALPACLPPSTRTGLRHHRAALRRRVRRARHGHALHGRAAAARRRLRRRPADRPRARVRHLPLRLDAGRQSPALAAVEDGSARGRDRRRGGSREPRVHVVALPLRHARRPDRSERLRPRGTRRSGVRAVRARTRRARRPRLSADGGGDDRDPRRLRLDPPARAPISSGRTSWRRCTGARRRQRRAAPPATGC